MLFFLFVFKIWMTALLQYLRIKANKIKALLSLPVRDAKNKKNVRKIFFRKNYGFSYINAFEQKNKNKNKNTSASIVRE